MTISKVKAGEKTTLSMQEYQALSVTGSADAQGVVYWLDDALGGGNSRKSWQVGAGALPVIGPYAGVNQFLLTCAVGTLTASVAAAVLTMSAATGYAPGAPSITSATAGDSTVTAAYVAGSAGSTATTSYDALLYAGGAQVAALTGVPNPVVFTSSQGVVNGTAYTVKVRANNAVGPGPLSAASNVVTPSAPALRQVATNTFIPDGRFTPNVEIGTRSPHTARVAMTSVAIVLANWYVLNSATETNPGTTLTAVASIEYPAGVFTRLNFGGANSGTAADGANLVSDSVAVNIPSGAKFWVRMKQTFPNGCLGFNFYAFDGTCQLQVSDTYGVVPDYTMGGGDWTATSGVGTNGVMAMPANIVANSAAPAAGFYGDSISVARGDTNDGTRANTQGHLGRAFGAVYPCGHVGVSGDTLQAFIAGSAKRRALAQYYSHIVLNMGINDVTSGRTAAQVQADTNTILGFFSGKKVAVCTLSPVTGSSDGWTTVANQTLSGTNSVRVAVNAQRKTNMPLAAVVYDVNAAIENIPSPEDGKFTVVGGANTADGTHPNATGYAAEAAGIDPSLLMAA